ncbi:MAG: pentapeptide repeat-containing protein [Rhodospirillales bacterium]
MNETLIRLVSDVWRQRVVGAAGLLPFFAADRADFHPQALAALIAAARFKEDQPAVRQGIRLAVERAAGAVAPALLTEMSWQGVRLPDVNLTKARLAGVDLRDAVLENARLSGAGLAGGRPDGGQPAGRAARWRRAAERGADLCRPGGRDAGRGDARRCHADERKSAEPRSRGRGFAGHRAWVARGAVGCDAQLAAGDFRRTGACRTRPHLRPRRTEIPRADAAVGIPAHWSPAAPGLPATTWCATCAGAAPT